MRSILKNSNGQVDSSIENYSPLWNDFGLITVSDFLNFDFQLLYANIDHDISMVSWNDMQSLLEIKKFL